jgi:hypothetical protein
MRRKKKVTSITSATQTVSLLGGVKVKRGRKSLTVNAAHKFVQGVSDALAKVFGEPSAAPAVERWIVHHEQRWLAALDGIPRARGATPTDEIAANQTSHKEFT